MKYKFLDFRDETDELEVTHSKGDSYVGFYTLGYIALDKVELKNLIQRLQTISDEMNKNG